MIGHLDLDAFFVFVPPDIAHYREWSRRVWDVVGGMSCCVEQLGLDEG